MPADLLVRIQSHPSRRELRKRLIAKLEGPPLEIVETDFKPPDPWAGYQACLAALPPAGHVLIVQDDAVACDNVIPAIERIIARHPNDVVALFVGMHTMGSKRQALMAGRERENYYALHRQGFMPVVATLWPVEQARDFLEWSSTMPARRGRCGPIQERSDDNVAGMWRRSRRRAILATIPSLFEHPDDTPSTIARKPGGRSAIFWHGSDWDALTVDW